MHVSGLDFGLNLDRLASVGAHDAAVRLGEAGWPRASWAEMASTKVNGSVVLPRPAMQKWAAVTIFRVRQRWAAKALLPMPAAP